MASRDDLEAAARLRRWADASSAPRKRASRIAEAFGRAKLTESARQVIDDALQACGMGTDPSMLACERNALVRLKVVGPPIVSDRVPSQLVTWHQFNWTGEGDSGPVGEWLRCLKATTSHDRQFVWSGSAISGVVTFSAWVRPGHRFYEGWASLTRLANPVSRETLLADPTTAPRFDANGIHALQGSPITLDAVIATAIADLAGGLPTTDIPLDEPDYSEEPILWTGLHGLSPEAHVEAAVAAHSSLWKKLGFAAPPARQRVLGAAGRVDLVSGDTVGEAKRAVTLSDGPDQIERYLAYLEHTRGRPRARLRGVLIQCSASISRAVTDRLAASPYRLELWSVTNRNGWHARRLNG